MTAQTPNPNLSEQEPFIPPFYMLILAAVGLIIAVLVALTQASFGVVGWGGLGLAVLSVVVWIFMAPDQAKSLITGRTARYGGTTVLVTLVFLMALIAIYSVVKGRAIRRDLTQVDTFSLNDQTRQAIAGLTVEPKVPNIKIFAFYPTAQASQKDQLTVLLDDYVKTSNNKISYEFVDPDRNPGVAQQYKVTGNASLAVVPLDDKGQPLADKAQAVSLANQENLTNAIMRVAASGDFRAYFLSVDGGLKLTDSGDSGMSKLNDILKNNLNWKTQEVSLLDLTSPQSTIKLNDPAADGEVLVIAGGNAPIPDEQLKVITDYLDKGGKLILFAAPLQANGKPTLASADNLNNYLYDKFGMRFNNDVVIDQKQALQTPLNPAATTFDSTQPITQSLAGNSQVFMLFETAHSINVSPTLPADVTVSQLVKSGSDSYSKTDPAALTATDMSQLDPKDTDAKGPFVMASAAENSKTGARVVLVGGQYVPSNQFIALRGTQVVNDTLTLNSFFWTTKFDEFFTKIPQLQATQKPQDQPIVMDGQTARTINFVIIVLMPFGVLLIGILVWWNGREKRTTV